MNLDELQSVRDSERRTDSLQELRESFYTDAGEFIQELRDRRERAAERADDPFESPEIDRLTSEIKAAEETVEAIYEKRLGKLVKAASLAAADMPAGTDGLTTEEQQLFETLVGDIKTNRQHVLDVLAGEDPDQTDSTDSGQRTGSTEDSAGAAGAADTGDGTTRAGSGDGTTRAGSGEGTQIASEESPRAETDRSQDVSERTRTPADATGGAENEKSTATSIDRERVRITADVGAIFGVDEREYDLTENDVVQLPRENAEPLLDRDAAERL